MEFKELSVAEIGRGYTYDDIKKECTCIFCGESFDCERIYNIGNKFFNAEYTVKNHVHRHHKGVFAELMDLDKELNGLSHAQKEILQSMYDNQSNKEIAKQLDISESTVRIHKYNLQKQKRAAKIFLAIMEQLEDEGLIDERNKFNQNKDGESLDGLFEPTTALAGNMLHPFFTQFNLK